MKFLQAQKLRKILVVAATMLTMAGTVVTARAAILFQDDNFGTVDSDNLVIDSNNTNGGNIVLQFGTTLAKTLLYSQANSRFEFNANVDLTNNQLSTARMENVAALPGGAGGLGAGGKGRLVQLTATDSVAPGCISPTCGSGSYSWDGSVWHALQGSITAATASKIVTVGPTGRDYTSIAAAATYLNTLSGGEMWVDPGTYPVTTVVDLSNIKIRGADTALTVIAVQTTGKLNVYQSKFETLTVNVDTAITAAMGMDVQFNAAASSAIEFNQVNFIVGAGKIGIDSTAATKPVTIATFNECTESSGTGTLLKTVATTDLSSSSVMTVINLLSSNPLKIVDWPVTIVGGSNVVTSGTINTVPDRTILVSPGMNIQGAINSLGANGGVVRLNIGTHDITAPLVISNDNIELTGEGPGTILRAQTAGWTGGTTGHDAVIQVGASNGTAPRNNTIISNFQLQVGPNVHGIEVNGGTQNKVLDMFVQSIGVKSATHTAIVFTDGSASAGSRFTASRNIVDRDIAADRWVDGVHFDGGAPVAGQTFGYGNGITDSIISEMVINEAAETSYDFTFMSASAIFSNRARNIGFNNGAFGLYLSNANDVMVMNNTIEGNNNVLTIGIELASTVTNSTILGNAIRGNPSNFASGLTVVDATSTANYIQENQVMNASTSFVDNGVSTNGNYGIGTAAPNTKLDVNGDLALRSNPVTLANGANNNVAIGSFTNIRITGPSAAFTITGLTGGVNGKTATLYNTTANAMTISNNNVLSLAANRILTLTGADIVVPGPGVANFIYDTTQSLWIFTGYNNTNTSSFSLPTQTGNANKYLQTNGTSPLWATPGPASKQIFTSGSATYTTPAGVTAIMVEIVGGGGGGGGSNGTLASTGAGGGGGAGGYTRFLITNPAASYTYTVGAGGLAGDATTSGTGGTGGTTLFGTALLSASGGTGGTGETGVATATPISIAGGAGGTGSGGDVNTVGSAGEGGLHLTAAQASSGAGGGSFFGGGAAGLSTNSANGNQGGNYGGGGSGAITNSATDRSGGAGGSGVVIVTEYK